MREIFIVLCVICISFSSAFQASLKRSLRPAKVYAKNDKVDKSTSKGFGKKQEVLKIPETLLPATADVPTITGEQPISSTNVALTQTNTTVADVIAGSAYMRKQEQEKIDSIQRKIDLLREEEELLATDPSVGAVPELVANRMIGRIIFFFGIPVFGGLSIFVAAFFASKYYDMVVPPPIVAFATQIPFVMGLLGISYAILSSSWDEADGSVLGFKEFQINVQRIRDGFKRSRETAKLQDEIEKDTKTLNRQQRRQR